MSAANVVTILDRIKDINGTISGVKTRRYFPQHLDAALLPLLVAFPSQATRVRKASETKKITRTFTISAFVGTFMEGLPTESAQKTAEALIEAMEDAYDVRPRLELGGNILDNLISSELATDTGITAVGDHAVIDFTLTVVYERDVSLV